MNKKTFREICHTLVSRENSACSIQDKYNLDKLIIFLLCNNNCLYDAEGVETICGVIHSYTDKEFKLGTVGACLRDVAFKYCHNNKIIVLYDSAMDPVIYGGTREYFNKVIIYISKRTLKRRTYDKLIGHIGRCEVKFMVSDSKITADNISTLKFSEWTQDMVVSLIEWAPWKIFAVLLFLLLAAAALYFVIDLYRGRFAVPVSEKQRSVKHSTSA